MQNITVIGRLGRDAELRQTADSRFISFTIAANSRVRGVDKTTWYDVISFNDKDIRIKDYLTKGSNIVVIGELDASIQEGRDGRQHLRLSITADKITFAGSSSSGSTQDSSTTVVSSAPARTTTVVEEDMPTTSSRSKAKAAPAPAPAPVAPEVEAPDEDEAEDDLPF